LAFIAKLIPVLFFSLQVMQPSGLDNPLLSHVAQFLPLRKLFDTVSRVCTTWAGVIFNLEHVRLACPEVDHVEYVCRRLNVARVLYLEIYANTGQHVLRAAQCFKNVICMLVYTIEGADFSSCASVEHLFVLNPGKALGLPPLLKSMMHSDALDCAFISKLPFLRRLDGKTRLSGSENYAVLESLHVGTACFNTIFDKRLQAMQIRDGWTFALALDRHTGCEFFESRCQLFHALRHVDLDVSGLSP
jgi:hypothetical protein